MTSTPSLPACAKFPHSTPPYRMGCESCLKAGKCLVAMNDRLATKIAEQDAARGRPLTNRERLNNLRRALWREPKHD